MVLYAAEAAAKIVAMGGSYHTIRLTLQEYFENWEQTKMGHLQCSARCPLRADAAGNPAIGGKDSMSGYL